MIEKRRCRSHAYLEILKENADLTQRQVEFVNVDLQNCRAVG